MPTHAKTKVALQVVVELDEVFETSTTFSEVLAAAGSTAVAKLTAVLDAGVRAGTSAVTKFSINPVHMVIASSTMTVEW